MSVEKYDKEQLKEMSDEAIVHSELQLDRDLVTIRFQKKSGNGRNIHQSKLVRRAIARLKTEQTLREKAAKVAKGSFLSQYKASFVASAIVVEKVSGSSFGADLNEQMEEEK
jgi:ribosomal protein L29